MKFYLKHFSYAKNDDIMICFNQLKDCDEYLKKYKLIGYNNIIKHMKTDLYNSFKIKILEEDIKNFEKGEDVKLIIPQEYKKYKYKCEKYIKIK